MYLSVAERVCLHTYKCCVACDQYADLHQATVARKEASTPRARRGEQEGPSVRARLQKVTVPTSPRGMRFARMVRRSAAGVCWWAGPWVRPSVCQSVYPGVLPAADEFPALAPPAVN